MSSPAMTGRAAAPSKGTTPPLTVAELAPLYVAALAELLDGARPFHEALAALLADPPTFPTPEGFAALVATFGTDLARLREDCDLLMEHARALGLNGAGSDRERAERRSR